MVGIFDEARNVASYERDPVAFLKSQHASEGDVFSVTRRMTVFCHPDVALEIMQRTDRDFELGGIRSAPVPPGATISEPVAELRTLRRVTASAMPRRHSQHWDTSLSASFRHEICRAATVGSIGLPQLYAMFGRATIPLLADEPAKEILARLAISDIHSTIEAVGASESLPTWMPLPGTFRDRRTRRRLLNAIRSDVGRALPADTRACPATFLGAMKRASGSALTPTGLAWSRSVLIDSMASPAVTLAWSIIELSGRPYLCRALSDEVDSISLSGQAEQLHSALPMLSAFVEEILRLHPPVWLLTRTIPRETALAGLHLPAGHSVAFSPLLLHRDSRWWADPDEFRLDRWIEHRRPPRRGAYVPFGGGPRGCPGARLSFIQIRCALAMLLRYSNFYGVAAEKAAVNRLGLLTPDEFRCTLSLR